MFFLLSYFFFFFFFNDTATTEIYTLSLHDALPIFGVPKDSLTDYGAIVPADFPVNSRSEEHTSELQSRFDLVCRLLLEKKKKKKNYKQTKTMSKFYMINVTVVVASACYHFFTHLYS